MWFRISRKFSEEAGEYLYKFQFLNNKEEPIDLDNVLLTKDQVREVRMSTFNFTEDLDVTVTAQKYSLSKEDI